MTSVANIMLNSGHSIPSIGLGTWKSKPGDVRAAVEHAIDCGYRLIDCASAYENEKEIGEAILSKINSGVVKREQLFITSKLWSTDQEPEYVKPALLSTLKDLQLDYIDLYLIHTPVGLKHGNGLLPMDENGKAICTDVDYIDTWKEMEKLHQEGLTRSIGVSNFNVIQIKRILENCSIQPCNNQVESHPFLLNEDMLKFCKSKNISFTAYSPFGSPDRPWATSNDVQLLEDPQIVKIANRIGKSPAQVLIRFQIQRGVIVIPKSVTPSRIQNNFDINDFALSDEDMQTIRMCDRNGRVCKMPWCFEHKFHPFKDECDE